MIHIRPVIIIYDSKAASEARRIDQSTEMANVDVESELVAQDIKRAEYSTVVGSRQQNKRRRKKKLAGESEHQSIAGKSKKKNKREKWKKASAVIRANVEPRQVTDQQRKFVARVPASRGHVSGSVRASTLDFGHRHSAPGQKLQFVA